MFELNDSELRQAKILTIIPLLLGLIWSWLPEPAIMPSVAVPAGKAEISISSIANPEVKNVVELHPMQPDHVFINKADFNQLLVCPGIGTSTANKILLERSFGNFTDWRDLKDRVKGISDTKIEKLQEAGVRLDP
jgi:DNA uptake protein ComE-like DNA-binding protein